MADGVERFSTPGDLGRKKPDGEWVRYSDYEKLKVQRDCANEALEEAERRAANWKRRAQSADRSRAQAVQFERQRIREALKEQAAEYRREANEAEDGGKLKMWAAADVVDCVTSIVLGDSDGAE